MRIERGTTRTAIIGEKYTVKFPSKRPDYTMNRLREVVLPVLRARFRKHRLMKWILSHDGLEYELRHLFLNGILANLQEWELRAYSDVLVPTRLSVFGLMNVQDTASLVDVKEAELVELIKPIFGTRKCKGAHTLHNKDNYGVHSGKVKLLDYGEPAIKEIIIEKTAEFAAVLKGIEELIEK